MNYAEMRAECDAAGVVKQQAGVDVCGLNRAVKCSGYSCPSKKYWNKAHKQFGYHKMRALEKAGLVHAFKEEMAE